MKEIDDLFDVIRNAPEDEAREVFENMKTTLMRGVGVAIMTRNFSHGVGPLLARLATAA